MIEIATRRDQHLAVFGLGASGIATATALARSGAVVSAWDDDETSRAQAAASGVKLEAISGDAISDRDWSGFEALVLSPGVPLTHPAPHPVVVRARAANCPVIGDIELLCEACPRAGVIAITGTNGKSTTTALVGHVLSEAGRTVQIGGNLGPPALSLEPLGADGIYVLELSSYQLDLADHARFGVAVLLNLSPDHLDRHGGMEGYSDAKRRIFRDRSGGGQTAIIGVDDDHGRALATEMDARGGWLVVRISSAARIEGGVYVVDGLLYDASDGPVCDLTTIDTLPGAHNWQNAAAAYAAARAVGVAPGDIARHLATYPGLAHRQETVAVIDGVRYVNDSKATNADAVARALACYDAVYWIAGGVGKEGGIAPILPLLGRVRHAFLIGEAAAALASQLADRVAITQSGDLAAALRAASAMARVERRPGATVLLSPACASFDQWKNFMVRGDSFRDQVGEIGREAPR